MRTCQTNDIYKQKTSTEVFKFASGTSPFMMFLSFFSLEALSIQSTYDAVDKPQFVTYKLTSHSL